MNDTTRDSGDYAGAVVRCPDCAGSGAENGVTGKGSCHRCVGTGRISGYCCDNGSFGDDHLCQKQPGTTTDQPPAQVLLWQGPQVQRVVYVDSFGWRCVVCGWIGEGLISMESAQRESWQHVKRNHPELETVNVTVLNR